MRLSITWLLVICLFGASWLIYSNGTTINKLKMIIETPPQAIIIKLPNGDVCVGVKVNGKEGYSCSPGLCGVRT